MSPSPRIKLGLDYRMCILPYLYQIALFLPLTDRTPKESAASLEVKDVIEWPHLMDKGRIGSAYRKDRSQSETQRKGRTYF